MATDTVAEPGVRGTAEAAGIRPGRTRLEDNKVAALRRLSDKGEPADVLRLMREGGERPRFNVSASTIRDELRDNTFASRSADSVNVRNRIRGYLDLHTGIVDRGYDGLPPGRARGPILNQMYTALETSVAGSAFQDIRYRGGIVDTSVIAMEYLKDARFIQEYRKAAETAADRLASEPFEPTPDQIDNKMRRIRAEGRNTVAIPPPGGAGVPHAGAMMRDMNDGELRDAAYNELFDSREQRIQSVLAPGAIFRSAVDSYEQYRISKLEEATNEGLTREMDIRFRNLEANWHQQPASNRRADVRAARAGGEQQIMNDFRRSMAGGGREIFTDEVWDQLSPEEREAYESKLADKLLIARAGCRTNISDQEYQQMATSDLLGKTAEARVDKIHDIFELVQRIGSERQAGRAVGVLNKEVWDKIKAAGPGAALSAGALAAILALITAPISLPATAIATMVAGGTGGVAGGIGMYKFGSRRDGA